MIIIALQEERVEHFDSRAAIDEQPLLEVVDLRKYFPVYGGVFSKVVDYVQAVDGVSFDVMPGETFGLVGESGCGKTTVGRVILRLTPATGGDVVFGGRRVFELSRTELRELRRDMQIVFQDPYGSLNPRMTVGELLSEPLQYHGLVTSAEKNDAVKEILETVKLHQSDASRYPHEFSGGQRQRIGIARAIALRPKLIICDEPVSALDVSIQAQILNLLEELQSKLGLTYIFIAHGLHVVKHISDRVGVMYLGKIVEIGDSDIIFSHPYHPYTLALMSAAPIPDPEVKKERILLEGDVPSPLNPPSGCRFRTRCFRAEERCSEMEPELKELEPGRFVACHLVAGS